MYGIEAITVHNGWAMAVAGVLIVFSGLVILSTTIAQFHKLLNFWEDRVINRRPKNDTADAPARDVKISPALGASARQFKLITNKIGEPFSLPKLLKLAELSGLAHPHSTINDLVRAGLIAPDGKGYFLWKK